MVSCVIPQACATFPSALRGRGMSASPSVDVPSTCLLLSCSAGAVKGGRRVAVEDGAVVELTRRRDLAARRCDVEYAAGLLSDVGVADPAWHLEPGTVRWERSARPPREGFVDAKDGRPEAIEERGAHNGCEYVEANAGRDKGADCQPLGGKDRFLQSSALAMLTDQKPIGICEYCRQQAAAIERSMYLATCQRSYH